MFTNALFRPCSERPSTKCNGVRFITSMACLIALQFTGLGIIPSQLSGDDAWVTNEEFTPEGSPQAVKGGAVRFSVGDFPATLRIFGKDANTTTNSLIESLCYDRLLGLHTDTLEFIPGLATHWSISEDKRVFRYKLNPKARWSDGKPVIADDVVATWDLMMDEKILDPSAQVVYGKFERPKAIAKDIVEVRSKDLNWRNFLYFSASLSILPAHVLKGLDGDQFLRKYQFELPIGSGPYIIQENDIKKGDYFTFRRRKDYWGQAERFATGMNNFDLIRCVTTVDDNLAYEKAKKGEIDIFRVAVAKDWNTDIPQLPQVKRGLLVAKRIYNDEPYSLNGVSFNMRVPPVNDVRIRKALSYAFNREAMLEKLMYNEYIPSDSYFGGQYANPKNAKIRFDLGKAEELLAMAGWKERDGQGYLTKNGQRLAVELTYSGESSIRFLTVYQEDCRRLGVQLDLKQVTPATRFKAAYGDRAFQATYQAWAGIIFPNPETSWLSILADEKNNNNMNGFKSPRVDELCKAYDGMFSVKERTACIQEIDGLVFEQHPYALAWYSNNMRLLYWNKFRQPEWFVGRTSRDESVLQLWWIDPKLDAQLKAAQNNPNLKMDPGPPEVRYWLDKAQTQATAAN